MPSAVLASDRSLTRALFFTCLLELVAVSCAHRSQSDLEAKSNPAAPLETLQKISSKTELFPKQMDSLDVLSKREFQEPDNATLKWLLSIAEWCTGEKGLAYERWLWIEQFHPQSEEAPLARALRDSARLKQDETVSKSLRCLEYFPKN